MRTATKIWLIVAAVLLVLGIILFVSTLNAGKFKENTYTITKDFNSLSIHSDANLVFALSDDGTCKVACFEGKRTSHSLFHEEGTLVIKAVNKRRWYDYLAICLRSPKITIYLPEAEYASLTIREDTGDIKIPKDFTFQNVDISLSTGDVDFAASVTDQIKIKTSTGNIRLENGSANALDLRATTGSITVSHVVCAGNATFRVSTGKVNLKNLVCQNLAAEGNTGDILLTSTIAAKKLSIETDTGDVKFDHSDAAEIFVETDTGNVTGTLLTEKIFLVETDTGRISVPKSVTGGKCEITTDTGNIKISITNE